MSLEFNMRSGNLNRDFLFNVIIGTPARNTVNSTKIGASISRRMAQVGEQSAGIDAHRSPSVDNQTGKFVVKSGVLTDLCG